MIGFLPNLIIIGAAKCGTTSLHRYLDHHPAIHMSGAKELEFFQRDDWRRNLDWYRSNFQVRAPVRGESSPAYSMDPRLPHVPERIREVIPRARIIYMVRDPVERTLAHYVELYALGMEDRPLERALADYESESNLYVMTSRYAHQLDRYRAHFPDSQIMVMDQRELRDDRRGALRRAFEFLGVDADFWTPDFEQMHNTRSTKMRLNSVGVALQKRGWVPRFRRWSKPVPNMLRERLKLLVAFEVSTPPYPEGLRGELAAFLRSDAERLRASTGQTLEHWSV